MNGGTKFLACSAMLIVSACVGEAGKLEIRSTPSPLAQGKKPVSFRVAEGHQQMAMNNVALALESYRNALREDPQSIDAHAGIAAAYDRMGRYDVARRSYEAALAIEPGNTTVLAMLAASLDQQGKPGAALAVRAEIKQRLAAATAAPIEAPRTAVAVVGERLKAPDMSVALADLASVPLAVSMSVAAPAAVAAVFAPDEPKPAPVPAAPAPAPVKAAAPPQQLAEVSKPAQSVTIKLPPPRPVTANPSVATASMASAVAAPPTPKPAPAPQAPRPAKPAIPAPVAVAAAALPSRPAAALPVSSGRGPRLERTSLGEVALLTKGAPQWASFVVKQSQRSATVRFVPLQQASARFASVKLLNAARVQGLAARTRSTLYDRGWRAMAIGDAPAIRSRSLVLYPAHRRVTALSLARQFGFDSAQRASGKEITVLLGRDAALLMRRSPAG